MAFIRVIHTTTVRVRLAYKEWQYGAALTEAYCPGVAAL